jgi:geranylgeranyl pyrophosphate synthase
VEIIAWKSSMDRSKDLLSRVEGCMRSATCTLGDGDALVVRSVTHHLSAGGGRIRALICLHACNQLGIADDTSVVLATACELLHNASLVQDDVFDQQTMRRGSKSVWNLFGETVAICAGDLMLSAAFAALAELPDASLIASSIQLAFRHTRSVIVGQGTEMNAVPKNLADYEVVAINKSASLLTLPLHLPLMVSGHSSFMALAQGTADSFAVAYQITDDLEDYPQDQQVGAVNVLSVLCSSGALDLDQARALATGRAVDLLHRCIADAVKLPQNCSAVMVSHASRMLADIAAKAGNEFAGAGSLQYVG